jgi:hypothetical protein
MQMPSCKACGGYTMFGYFRIRCACTEVVASIGLFNLGTPLYTLPEAVAGMANSGTMSFNSGGVLYQELMFLVLHLTLLQFLQ